MFAEFAVDQQETCSREVKNVATLCARGTVLDGAYYTTGFNVLKVIFIHCPNAAYYEELN
jgi:hypothetical protein